MAHSFLSHAAHAQKVPTVYQKLGWTLGDKVNKMVPALTVLTVYGETDQ